MKKTERARISEDEFRRICDGIYEDRDAIIKHNPIGTGDETLLWMLMCCLISYLSLEPEETPCFTGKPNADTYREAIHFMLRGRSETNFDPEPDLVKLLSDEDTAI